MLPPPMISVPAITPPPSYCRSPASDVDLRRERVVFDERAPVLDDLAHELREQHLGLRGVLDRHLLERARLRVHRGLAQLLGVHLAEALEPVQTDPGLLAHDIEDRVAQRLERRRLLGLVAERHRERRHAGTLDQRRVHAQEAAVLGRLEQVAGDAMRRRQASLRLDRADAHRRVVLVEQLGAEDRAVLGRLRDHADRLLGGLDVLVEQRALLEEAHDLVPVLRTQRARPPLVLLAQARVLLPARLGELERLVVAVEDLDAVELVREKDLLELGLLLDVSLVAALLELVQRRLGDVDVARLDQILHLAEQQGEDQRADVRPVHVGVRHEDHLVVAGPLQVELVADPRANGRDQRLDLLVAQHLVDARALDVEDLAAQRQDRLRVAVAALLGRAAGGVALHDEDLAQRRVLDRAIGELARQAGVLERALAPGEITRLARGRARLRCRDRLADDLARLGRVLLQELGELLVDDRGDEALHARVTELGLRLALELRVGQLGRDHRGEPLAHVLAGEVVVLLLELALLTSVAVERARERRAEARQVRAALVRVDVVREREDRLLVGGVPLQRDLDGALGALALEEDDLLLDRVLAVVEVADEVLDSALVLELDVVATAALVGERDPQAARQERRLAQALLEDREVEIERLEDVGVRQEADRRAGRLRRLALDEVVARLAAVVLLRPDEAVAADLDADGLAQRVDHGDADAVQAAGDLVAAAVAELAAGVQDGQHHLDRRPALLLHDGDGDAAAVVDHGDRVVGVNRDVHARRVARERLVDGVVHDLVDEVVKAAHTGRADVHARALADRLETLQDGDVLGVVCPAFLVLRHVPPNDVKNPGSGLADTRPGHEPIMCTKDSRQGPHPDRARPRESPAKRGFRARGEGSLEPPPRGDRLAAQRAHLRRPQKFVEPGYQIGSHQVELLRPDGRRAGHDEDAVALAGGLGLGGDEVPDRRGPDALDVRQDGLRGEALGERGDRGAGRARGVAPHAASAGVGSAVTAPTATARRTTPAAPAPGTCARSVVVMTLWPAPASRSTSRPRRSASSSLMTSSSRTSGGAPRSASSAARSASRSARSVSRCSPCDPYTRSSRPSRSRSSSSRCGPWPVNPRSRSESSRTASSAASSSALVASERGR